jgi:nucleoside-diphosphate-sugar epimerase
MEKVYITGCNGFVGRKLFQHFSQVPDIEVFGITRGSNRVRQNIIYSDYHDAQFIADLVAPNAHVIHTACVIPQDWQDRAAIEANERISSFVVNAFDQAKIRTLLHFSSISVYGYGMQELDHVTEDANIVLSNAYARAKYHSEVLLSHAFAQVYHLRMSSPFSREEQRNRLIYQIIDDFFADRSLTVYGQGVRKQDFIWLDDVARLVEQMIRITPPAGAYNLAAGQSYSVMELIRLLERLSGKQATITSVDREEAPSVTVDNRKILQALGWDCDALTTMERALGEWLT